jgi:quercetin dioxygenase-like cupin family protein
MTATLRRQALAPEQALAALGGVGDTVRPWSAPPGACFSLHEHAARKLLVVLRGSITFTVGTDVLAMTRGDLLELEAHTMHEAVVGPDGVDCAETFVPEVPPEESTNQPTEG